MTTPRVVHVIPDKMGGAMNIVASLLAFREDDGMGHDVLLTHNTLEPETRFEGTLKADAQQTVEFTLPVENLYAVLRRLRKALPDGGGVLVIHDLLGLALVHHYDPGMMVVQVAHGDYDYYYDLAERHQAVIDVFVGYSRRVCDQLRQRLPSRTDDIFYLPYGVPPATRRRSPQPGALRLAYVGRLDEQKGVFDLPEIDARLQQRGAAVEWTIIGGGPDERALRERWTAPHVSWRGSLPHDAVLAALPDSDVFVLPTRAEGFPVAMVEAMACGLVPVVSDIPSGVPEVVDHGVTGYRPAVGDVDGFAQAIATLADDRARLEAMSAAAHARVAGNFDARTRTREYQQLFRQWRERHRPRRQGLQVPYGSRLDQPWIPNLVVRAVRSSIRQWQGKPW